MAEQLIDSFVSDKGQAQLDAAYMTLEQILQEITLINKTGINFGQNLKSSGNLKDLTLNTAKLENQLAMLQDRQNKAAISAVRLEEAKARVAKATAKEAAATQAANSAYGQLSAEYNKAARAAQDLAVTQGRTSQAFLDAAAKAKQLHTQLLDIDEAVGKSQRNVGNYAAGFNKVWSGLKTIANILPGLGIAGLFGMIFEGIQSVLSLDIAGYFKSSAEAAKEAAEENEKYAASVKKVNDAVLERVNNINEEINANQKRASLSASQIKRELDLLEAQGASADKIAAKRKEYNQQIIFDLERQKSYYVAVRDEISRNFDYYNQWISDKRTRDDAFTKSVSLTLQKQLRFTKEEADAEAKIITENYNTKSGLLLRFRDKTSEIDEQIKDARNQMAVDEIKAAREAAEKMTKALFEGRDKPIIQSAKTTYSGIKGLLTDAITPPDAKDMTDTWVRAFDYMNNEINQKRREAAEKRQKELKEQEINTLIEIGKIGAEVVVNFQKTRLQNELKALNDRKQIIDENLNYELLSIDATNKSEEDKAKLKMQAQAKAAEDNKRLIEEENKLKRRQAELDREQALVDIAINTAVAVSKVWGETGLFGIAAEVFPLAMGAAQAALVLSQPLPQYYKGVESSPEGPAWIGERGTEMRINPDGRLELTPNTATLDYLQKGTTIIPHDQTMSIINNLAKGVLPERKEQMFSNTDIVEAVKENTKIIARELRKTQQSTGNSQIDLYELRRTRRMF